MVDNTNSKALYSLTSAAANTGSGDLTLARLPLVFIYAFPQSQSALAMYGAGKDHHSNKHYCIHCAIRLTGVDLLVSGYAISIHDGLEASGELVDLVVGGRVLLGLHAIEDGGHGGTTPLLHTQSHDCHVTTPNGHVTLTVPLVSALCI